MTIELGLAQAIDAQTFGQPGQRTFRLRVLGSASQSASLWMEKEQLQALSLALSQLLAQLSYEQQPSGLKISDFPEVPEHDFRVGRMAIGFDPSEGTLVFCTYEPSSEDEVDPSLRVRLTQDQCASLRDNLNGVIAAGRPICPLCHLAMDASGHACSRANGHSRQPLPEENAGDDR